jgi:hypothetical protein
MNAGLAEVEAELDAVEQKITAATAGIDRYLAAFEAGDLPQAVCGPRVQALAETADALRTRRDELHNELESALPDAPSAEDLAHLAGGLREAIATGDATQRRRFIEQLIHEIRIEGRHRIIPTWRLPEPRTFNQQSKVREMTGSVPPAGFEPALSSPEH